MHRSFVESNPGSWVQGTGTASARYTSVPGKQTCQRLWIGGLVSCYPTSGLSAFSAGHKYPNDDVAYLEGCDCRNCLVDLELEYSSGVVRI